jgi:PQQ-dependent catabolism-associated CXXCW motif protein
MLALLLILAIPISPAAAANADFDPVTGYRIAHYRGVVPAPPQGVVRIDAAAAQRLWAGRRAVFIDLTPAEGGQRDPVSGAWSLAQMHRSIPRAHWFPEAGRGVPRADIAAWFDRGVARIAGKHRTIVAFCLADCWMSWNAALRLHRAGHTDVRWFAEGLDGWRDIAGPTVIATPAQ